MYFDKPYNRTIFLNLLQSKMFPNFVRKEEHLWFWNKTAYFVENWIYKLWTVNLDKEITILEIEQKSSNDPRITLTKDAFKILEYHGIDHAVIIFHCKDTTSYRLSLLTVSYENWEKRTSSYKRFSYILWPNEKIRTPEMQLLHQINDYDDLVSRFDVEVVRKEFFDKYLELFVRLYKEIKLDTWFFDLLKQQNVDVVSFTKNLLWKIVFLYFIQQKWWLWLWRNTTTKYWEWNKDFMRVMWNNFESSKESMSSEKTGYFYNDYLEWLFFDGLNKDRRDDDDRFPNLQMKVPYLNWWLFKEEYTWWESYVTKISNDIFSNKKEKWDDADWILDIFDRYNFTIDEDSLYDKDVAVDPEMLGKIFENMISISEENIEDVVKIYDSKKKWTKIDFWKALNKDLWAFYTPREIVHYMTRESLIAYLVSNLKWNSTENESLIRDLFDLKEKFLLSSDDMKKSWYSEDQLKKLSEIILDVDNALSSVKILDPAIWSWAFPMWILHEISSLRYYMYWTFFRIFWDTTSQFKNDKWNISLYKIKRDIILNSIYWVDIDPWAIDIARLRFWLSLVVDAEEPEPLPNFEFKFVCANTLLPLKDSAREKDLFSTWDEPKLETLKRYKRDFYNADKKIEKKQLKERIREYTKIEHTLFSEPTPRAKQMEEFWKFFDNPKHSHSFFDSWLMLSESKWFDIVIWNPPYIQLQKNKWELWKLYQDCGFESFVWTGDIYCLFYEKGFQLLKQWWILAYITSNKWMRAWYWENLRSYFSKNTNPLYLIDLWPWIFETATVDTNIFIWKKEKRQEFQLKWIDLTKEEKVSNIEWFYDKAVNITKLSEQPWTILSDIERNIKEKIERIWTPLKDWDIEINYWIKTWCNEAFIIDWKKKDELIKEDPKSAEIIRPILRGRDIKRYNYEFADLYIIATFPSKHYNIDNYPAIKKYLQSFWVNRLEQTWKKYVIDWKEVVARKKTNNNRFETQDSIAYWDVFSKPKIIYPETSSWVNFVLDYNSFYTDKTWFIMYWNNLNSLVWVLNSKLLLWYIKYITPNLWNWTFTMWKIFIETIPIPKGITLFEKDIQDFIFKKNYSEIDEIVYKIYSLTPEEILYINNLSN